MPAVGFFRVSAVTSEVISRAAGAIIAVVHEDQSSSVIRSVREVDLKGLDSLVMDREDLPAQYALTPVGSVYTEPALDAGDSEGPNPALGGYS